MRARIVIFITCLFAIMLIATSCSNNDHVNNLAINEERKNRIDDLQVNDNSAIDQDRNNTDVNDDANEMGDFREDEGIDVDSANDVTDEQSDEIQLDEVQSPEPDQDFQREDGNDVGIETEANMEQDNFMDPNEAERDDHSNEMNLQENRVLRIGYYRGDERISTRLEELYTKSFQWDHPNVEIEFMTANPSFDAFSIELVEPVEEMKKLLTSDNPPDLVMLSYVDYLELMNDGYLVALEPFLSKSELEKEDYVTQLIEALTNPFDGQIYGLAPTIESAALVYNKTLFDEAGIPYPRDRMTWEEVFSVARQITAPEDGVYGLLFDMYNYRPPKSDDILTWYTPGLDLSLLDDDGNFIVNNDDWRRIIQTFKELVDEGVFPLPEARNSVMIKNKFLSGNVAMVLATYTNLRAFMDQISSQGDEIFEWDIVTVPVHPQSPNVGAGMSMDPVFAINAQGINQHDAWALIESIHSSDWAKANEVYYSQVSSLQQFAEVNSSELDFNKAALYQLLPETKGLHYTPVNTQFRAKTIEHTVATILPMDSIYNGGMSIDEAITYWEQWGLARLNEINR